MTIRVKDGANLPKARGLQGKSIMIEGGVSLDVITNDNAARVTDTAAAAALTLNSSGSVSLRSTGGDAVYGSAVIGRGVVTLSGGNGGKVASKPIDISQYGGGTILVGANESTAAQWDESTALNSYSYLSIAPLGVTVSGQVESYNPKNATTVKLLQGGEVKYTGRIEAETGSGKKTQSFSINAVAVGVYDLVVEKAGHLTYTITGVSVGTENLDLTAHTNAKISKITLLCGDIDGNGHINFGDYEKLLSTDNYGKQVDEPGVNSKADLDGNGHINFSDYEILLSGLHYGKSNSDCVVNFN